MQPQYLTEKHVATRLHVSTKKLQKDRQQGKGIKYYKFGRLVRYRPEDVEAYLNQKQCLTLDCIPNNA